MSSSHYLPDSLIRPVRAMIFVDGENLAIRYEALLSDRKKQSHVHFLKDVYAWSRFANIPHHVHCEVIRKYYYTAIQGDDPTIEAVETQLKDIGIEAPRVFKKSKGRSSKQVDITLAVEMLSHAHRGNYDIAILVAGDEDYVPLVKAVKNEGRRVFLWFFEEDSGLSKKLKKEADYYFNISFFLYKPEDEVRKYYNW